MGMTVRLTDGRVTVTVEGVEEAKRMQDGQAVPLAAESIPMPMTSNPRAQAAALPPIHHSALPGAK